MPGSDANETERFLFMITFSCHANRRVLDNDKAKYIVASCLSRQLGEHNASCGAFVIMPDHVHALIDIQPKVLPTLMKWWKQRSSFRLKELLSESLVAYGAKVGPSQPVWTPGYNRVILETEEEVARALDYIHQNPFEAGLVSRAEDWQFSSAGFYETGGRPLVPIEQLF